MSDGTVASVGVLDTVPISGQYHVLCNELCFLEMTYCSNVYRTLRAAPISIPALNSWLSTSPGTSTPTTEQDLYSP
jgi:hypothetical protein